jgi:phosphopantothenoylcysteine synthetase/decarboxylase
VKIKNKRILITAGPTWVPIDKVRVISNTATGQTGILLAEKLQSKGAKVTLLLGPTEACCISAGIKVIRFKFFDELEESLIHELRRNKYDVLVHSAAVSDYKVRGAYRPKVSSDKKLWNLSLVPTRKIIDSIKKVSPSLFLVGFKFIPDSTERALVIAAKALMVHSGSDLVVANTLINNRYRARIVKKNAVSRSFLSKEDLVKSLVSEIGGDQCLE